MTAPPAAPSSAEGCATATTPSTSAAPAAVAAAGAPAAAETPAADGEALPTSIGSVGHPLKCLMPCKYYWKPRGCKDAANCRRCHYCPWQPQLGRPIAKAVSSEPGEAEKSTSTLREERDQRILDNAAKYRSVSEAELIKLLPARPDGRTSSVGTMMHSGGNCIRCVHIETPEGCPVGIRCKFCHADHPKPGGQQQERKRPAEDGGASGSRKRARGGGGGGGGKRPRYLSDSEGSDDSIPRTQPSAALAPLHPAYAYPPMNPYMHYPPPGYGGYPPPPHHPGYWPMPPPPGYYPPPPGHPQAPPETQPHMPPPAGPWGPPPPQYPHYPPPPHPGYYPPPPVVAYR